MKVAKRFYAGLLCVLSAILAGSLPAQEVRASLANPDVAIAESSLVVNPGCNNVSGSRFNLEPRLNAGPQNSESVDFLPNRVSPGVDLVVGAGDDQAADGNSNRLGGLDAYYVQRQGSNCKVSFEGTLSTAAIKPTVVADPARDAFFLSDQLLSLSQIVEVARSTAATLLSTTACPSGSQFNGNNPNCWPVLGTANFTNSNPNIQAALLRSHMAVDPRTTGTGAGDVYVVAQYQNSTNFPAVDNVQIIACTNLTLSCGSPVVASGADTFGSAPYVQVRQDGLITISYWTFTKPFGTQPNPIQIKFVTCTPQGAPKAPVCATPTLVANSSVPGLFAPGGSGFHNFLLPKHVNRTEAGGKTFTTFLIYDRCQAIVGTPNTLTPVCSKVDVVETFSTNGGATWSTPTAVETTGHQFMGMIRNDVSTQTINIAYYSTQADLFSQRVKIHLRQIAAGSTALGSANVLTSMSTDPDAGIQDIIEPGGEGFINFGDRIGLAAAGTGTAGQSKVYVHYTWNNVFGKFDGISDPDQNNTLTGFSY